MGLYSLFQSRPKPPTYLAVPAPPISREDPFSLMLFYGIDSVLGIGLDHLLQHGYIQYSYPPHTPHTPAHCVIAPTKMFAQRILPSLTVKEDV